MAKKRIVPYPLRIPASLRKWVQEKAKSNRRSVNAELLVIIETAKEAKEKKELKEQKFKEA